MSIPRSAVALALLAATALPAAAVAASPASPPATLAACAARLRAAPRDDEAAKCLYQAARAPETEREALGLMERLVAEGSTSARLRFYLGHLRWSDPPRAESHYRAAAELFARERDARGEVLARHNLRAMLWAQGRPGEAAEEARRTLRVAVAAGDPELIARAKVGMAWQLWETGGDLARALELLRQEERGVLRAADYHLRRDWLLARAEILFELGQRQAARAAFRRLAAETAAAGDAYAGSTAYYGLARVAFDEAAELPREIAVEEARAAAGAALAAAATAGNATNLAHAHWILGSLGRDRGAAEHLERCLAAAPTDLARSYCLHALARFHAADDPRRARAALERAFALARRVEDPWSLILCWRERMRLAWTAATPDDAHAEGLAALAVIEALRDEQRSETGRAELFSTWVEDYHWLSGRLLAAFAESGDAALLARAFAVTERMRARTLLDRLDRFAAPRAAATALPASFASLVEVQRALAPDEALLSFQVAPDEDVGGRFAGGAWAIVVTRDRARAHRLEGRVELRSLVAFFDGLVPRRDGTDGDGAAALHGRLLQAPLAELPTAVRRLVLVPDDDLHRLPFAALRAGAGRPPLGTRYQLTVVPSATLWLRWRQPAAQASPRPVLALADPPAPGAATIAWRGGGPAERAAVLGSAARLPPLPFARREARAVKRHLGGRTELRLGDDASEAFLKRTAGRFGLIHFAAHALAGDAEAERSAVVLAPGAAAEDGLLEAREIAGLDLDGAVVVLASCRSGSGQVLRGEGVMGLARAFFQAGARAVVASLWTVRDDEAAALFDGFYGHLGRGATLAAALGAAQEERIAAGAPASAWAGLVVLGDGELVPAAALERRRPGGGALVAVALAAAAAAVFYAGRRRRRLAAGIDSQRSRAT